MTILSKIKDNPRLKKAALFLIIPKFDYRPRLWVRIFLNPFIHKRGKNSIVRCKSRMDLFPFNKFSLGNESLIEDFATVNNGVGAVNIGKQTIIGIGCVIIGPVTIGNNVMLAQNIVVSGLNHGYTDISIPPSLQKVSTDEIVISDNVWIGANAVITAGTRIGRHSIIGAGSIVTKDVPEYSVVVGNPASVIKRYNKDKSIWEKVKRS